MELQTVYNANSNVMIVLKPRIFVYHVKVQTELLGVH